MRCRLLGVLTLLTCLIAGCAPAGMSRETIILGGHELDVWVAESPSQHIAGLQAVPRIEEGEGMLFVWDDVDGRVFEIKDVEYPVDVIFVDIEGRVVDIDTIEPTGEAVASSEQDIFVVVEVVGGWAEANGVAEGSILMREGR